MKNILNFGFGHFQESGIVGPYFLKYLSFGKIKLGDRMVIRGHETKAGVIHIEYITTRNIETGSTFSIDYHIKFNNKQEYRKIFMDSTKATKALYGF